VATPIAATSVAGSPPLSTPSGAAFFDGTAMVRMAVADRDRRGRQPSCKRLHPTAADVGHVLENLSRLFSELNRFGQPDLADGCDGRYAEVHGRQSDDGLAGMESDARHRQGWGVPAANPAHPAHWPVTLYMTENTVYSTIRSISQHFGRQLCH